MASTQAILNLKRLWYKAKLAMVAVDDGRSPANLLTTAYVFLVKSKLKKYRAAGVFFWLRDPQKREGILAVQITAICRSRQHSWFAGNHSAGNHSCLPMPKNVASQPHSTSFME
jgi:hypothetical protein